MHPTIFAPDDIKPPASKDAYSAMTIRAARLPHRVFPVRQNGEHHQQTKGTPPASDTWSRPLPRDPDGPLATAHPRQPPKNALGVSDHFRLRFRRSCSEFVTRLPVVSTVREDGGHHRCGWVMCVEFEFKSSAFRHGCSAQDIETAWRQWLTDFIEGDHPVKVVRLGFDRVGRLLEVGAHTLDDGDRVIVFHAMPARKRYTDVI